MITIVTTTLHLHVAGENDIVQVSLFGDFRFPDGELQHHGSVLQILVFVKLGIDGIKIGIQTMGGDERNAP